MALPNQKTEFDFMGKRSITAALSLLLILVSLVSLGMRGLNFGVDFTGGVLLEAEYSETADLAGIRQVLGEGGFGNAQVQNFGTSTDVLIRVLPQEGVEGAVLGEQLLGILRVADATVDLRRLEFVGPQVGEELTEQGGLAMLFAIIMILFYIMFRFQWKFAVGSVIALVHDVIITLGVFSIFQFSFDLSVLAALLAVIGYSLNDTIVVFDRIRENFHVIRKQTPVKIVNTSVNQMLGRTVVTSMTTLLVLVALLLLGGEAMRGFSMALIIGVLVGTYSSIYTASAAALALKVNPVDLLPPKIEDAVDDMP